MKKLLITLSVLVVSGSMAAKPVEKVGEDGLKDSVREKILDPKYGYEIGDCSLLKRKHDSKLVANILKDGQMMCYVKKGISSTRPNVMRPVCKDVERQYGDFTQFCKKSETKRCLDADSNIKVCPEPPTCKKVIAEYGSVQEFCKKWDSTPYSYRYCTHGFHDEWHTSCD